MEDYDDEYSSCAETWATFRIIHNDLDPDVISTQLALQPSWSVRRGERFPERKRPSKIGMWGLDSEHQIHSRDLRRHLDWVLDQLVGKEAVLDALFVQGYTIDMFCYWERRGNSGGPMISLTNMEKLLRCHATLSFEVLYESLGEGDKEGDQDELPTQQSDTDDPSVEP